MDRNQPLQQLVGAAVLVLFIATRLGAAPVISAASVSGSLGEGSSVTVTGSGFGSKSTAKPALYAPLHDGTTVPSSLGTNAGTWSETSHAASTTTVTREGTSSLGSTSGWETSNFYVAFQAAGITYGQKYYVGYWRYSTQTFDSTAYSASQNMKYFRMGTGGETIQPDFYTGTQQDSATNRIFYVETDTATTTSNRQFLTEPVPPARWQHEEWVMQLNSAARATDGYLEYIVDGVSQGTVTTWQTDGGSKLGAMDFIFIEQDPSNQPAGGFPGFGAVYLDSVMADTAWERVYVCDNSTFAGAHCEAQPASAWSDTGITFPYQPGSLTGGQSKWVFVVDASRNVSAGLSLTGLGKGTACPCR